MPTGVLASSGRGTSIADRLRTSSGRITLTRVPSPLQPGNRVVVVRRRDPRRRARRTAAPPARPPPRWPSRSGRGPDRLGRRRVGGPDRSGVAATARSSRYVRSAAPGRRGSWLRGGPSRARTCGLRLVRAPLFQLSYGSAPGDPGQTSLTTATTALSPCARTSAPEHARQRRRHLVGQPGHVGPLRSRLVETGRYDDRLPRSDAPTGAGRGLAQSAYQHRCPTGGAPVEVCRPVPAALAVGADQHLPAGLHPALPR